MTCSSQSTNVFPVANGSLPANETIPDRDAWLFYLAQNMFNETHFDNSATLQMARQTVESCPEWDLTCQDTHQIFANQTNLGICSLYPNITGDSSNSTVVPAVKSLLPTCLIGYCALTPACSQTEFCTSSSFLTASGDLSFQGVGDCWYTICTTYDPHVNSDFGGIGVCGFLHGQKDLLLIQIADYFLPDADNYCITRFCDFGHRSCAQILQI